MPPRYLQPLLLCCLLARAANAAEVSLLGYTGGGKFPPAAPSSPARPVDIRPQLQAAIDEVAASGGGTVLLPGDTDYYFVSRPVFLDKPNVTLRGEAQTRLATTEGGAGDNACMPPVLVGLPRQVPGKEISAGHRQDVGFDAAHPAQTLDATATKRYGLRTKARNPGGTDDVYAHAYVANSVLAMGPLEPRYLGQYTLWRCPHDGDGKPRPDQYIIGFDLAVKQNTNGVMQGTICGAGTANNINNRFTYWMLGSFPRDADPNLIKFKFKTGDAARGAATVHELTLAPIQDTNLHRISIQLDIGSGQCAAWLDGRQTAKLALGSVANADGTINPQKELWKYEHGGFQLGALHNGCLGDVGSEGLVPTQQHVDWTYAGFQMSVGQRYTWDETLQRLDKQPLTDASRFFAPAYGVMAANLPLGDSPDTTDCILTGVSEGQGRGDALGLWLPERMPVKDVDGLYGLRNIGLEGLALGGPLEVAEVRSLHLFQVNPRGQNVFTYDDLNSGVMNGNDLPVIQDTDCSRYVYSPASSVLFWQNKNLQSTNFNTYTTYGTTIRLVGCHGDIHYLFLNPTTGERYLQSFAGARGGTLSISDPILDNEGYPIPTQAMFTAEFGPLGHGVTRATNRFIFHNVFTGTVPYTTPILELPNIGEGSITFENIAPSVIGNEFMKRLILDRNPNAYGNVRIYLPNVPLWQNSTFYGPPTNPNYIYMNRADGHLYRSTITHHPGLEYERNAAGQLTSEDNRPHADEAWKTYWSREANSPAAWKSGATYAAGDVVMSDTPIIIYVNLPQAYRSLQAHTAGDANKPGIGADWQKTWAPLEWTAGKSYVAATDFVTADGAYYRAKANNTASAANRPRPWDRVAGDAATWPFQIVDYAGPAGTTCKITTTHYEEEQGVPPTEGVWKPGVDLVEVPNPQPGQPTVYRPVEAGGALAFRGEKPLGPPR